ncbi:AsmA-like C-terminal region [Verrucomicrobium sp. GAS474]|uniref:AsmA-like C-terminal region-containing protein n=1 Tax=Verrucomicrobium sp. GAS474 TaxID=1882831 RepID=UPI00087CF0B9|nr:AsmA-like C-terminal region-containing protein [Verrucomicrobium sp. GAS474]SDU09853.1 AsmA-like C-terminal region [Verrucomicrobium sp. GAS474]
MEETKPEPPEQPKPPGPPTPEKAKEEQGCDGAVNAVSQEVHEVVDHMLRAGKAAEEATIAATRRTWSRLQKFLAGLGLSTLGVIVTAILVVVLILRFYGLPPQVKAYVLKELEERGIAVSFDKLLLDPTGAILAERLSVFRTTERQDLILQVDQVRLGIAWFSWWRGQPLLQSATVRNAAVHLPLTPDSTVNLTQVNARVDWTQGGKGIVIRQAQARLLNLEFDVRGSILIDGPLPVRKSAVDASARERIDALWRQVVAVADDFDTQRPVPVRIDFALATSTPENATVHALVATKNIRWRGVLINEVEAGADLQDGAATLSECRVKLARGEFTASGEASLKDATARLEFFSNLDFTPLASALSPKVATVVGQFRFDDLPAFSGRASASWNGPLALNVQADVDWENFSCAGIYYDRLVIPLAYDGQRFFIPEARLEQRNGGRGTLSLLWNRGTPPAPGDTAANGGTNAAAAAVSVAPSIRGKVDSTLDPTVFFGLFGPAADAFLGSLWFDGQKSAPVLAATLEGASADYNDWLVSGQLKVGKCEYKKIAIDSFDAAFAYRNKAINVKSFTVRRKEGTATGAVIDDFANRMVKIPGITSTVTIQEVAPALGVKFTGYVAPYVFDKPPKLKVSGTVDLNETRPKLDTDLTIAVDSDATLFYKIYKIPFPVEKTKATIRIVDRTLDLKLDSARLFDGGLTGTIRILLTEEQALDTALRITDGDFHKAMYTLYKSDKESGRLNLQLNLAGKLGDISSFKGGGAFTVDDGYVLSIPFLGGLSNLVSSIIPGFGTSKADQGKCSFTITNGVLHTDDLSIASAFFNVLGTGDVDFAKNAVSLDMRVNLRGIMSFLGYPLSKLFEYHGSGTLESLDWKSKNL